MLSQKQRISPLSCRFFEYCTHVSLQKIEVSSETDTKPSLQLPHEAAPRSLRQDQKSLRRFSKCSFHMERLKFGTGDINIAIIEILCRKLHYSSLPCSILLALRSAYYEEPHFTNEGIPRHRMAWIFNYEMFHKGLRRGILSRSRWWLFGHEVWGWVEKMDTCREFFNEFNAAGRNAWGKVSQLTPEKDKECGKRNHLWKVELGSFYHSVYRMTQFDHFWIGSREL